MTLTLAQKNKVVGFEFEQWDRIKTDLTNEYLERAGVSREMFRTLIIPNLDRVQFWNIVQKIAKRDLEEILSELYNALKDNQRQAIYEEMIEKHYLFSENEKIILKRDFRQTNAGRKKALWKEILNHEKNKEKIKKIELVEVEKVLEQQIQKNPSYGSPNSNTVKRQNELWELQKELEKTKKSNRKELKDYLEMFYILSATAEETFTKILQEVSTGEGLEEQFGNDDPEFKEFLKELKKEIAEKATKVSEEVEKELGELKRQSQTLGDGYNGDFAEGKKELENLEKRYQESKEKLIKIFKKIEVRGGGLRIGIYSAMEKGIESLGEIFAMVNCALEENQKKLRDLIITKNTSFIKGLAAWQWADFIQSAIISLTSKKDKSRETGLNPEELQKQQSQLRELTLLLIPNFAESNDNYISIISEKITEINYENKLLKDKITELEKKKLDHEEKVLIKNIKNVAACNYFACSEEELKRLKRVSELYKNKKRENYPQLWELIDPTATIVDKIIDFDTKYKKLHGELVSKNNSFQKSQKELHKIQQIFSKHLKDSASILFNSGSTLTNPNSLDLVELEKEGEKIKNECQINQRKICQLEGQTTELTTKNQNLTTQLTAAENNLITFQEQIEKVNEDNLNWEEKYKELDENYLETRLDVDGLKFANNSLKSEWRKESEATKELKIKISSLEQQLQNDLDLFLKIKTKQKELKQLKITVKNKLENNEQKSLLSVLLTSQEQIVRFSNSNSLIVNLSTKQFQKVKTSLNTKLTDEEIETLCQLQTEITKLEMKLENLQAEKTESKIEIPPYNS